jgi:hypothetical protein
MKRRFPIFSLSAIVLLLLQTFAPLAHRAWGHEAACGHAACTTRPEGTPALTSASPICETCARIDKLHAGATPSSTSRAVSNPREGIGLRLRDALRVGALDLSSGGARGPPR